MSSAEDIRRQLEENRQRLESLRAARAAQSANRLKALNSPATTPSANPLQHHNTAPVLSTAVGGTSTSNNNTPVQSRSNTPSPAQQRIVNPPISPSVSSLQNAHEAATPQSQPQEPAATTQPSASSHVLQGNATIVADTTGNNTVVEEAASTRPTNSFANFSFSNMARVQSVTVPSSGNLFNGPASTVDAVSNRGDSDDALAQRRKAESLQRRVECEHINTWAMDTMQSLIEEEASVRVELLSAFINGPAMHKEWTRCMKLRDEYAHDAPLSKASSLKVMELLQHGSSSSTDGDGRDDVVMPTTQMEDEAVLRMLKQYKRDRDYAEDKLKETISKLQQREATLVQESHQHEQSAKVLQALVDQLKNEALAAHGYQEGRIQELMAMKAQLAALEVERSQLHKSVGEYEQQIQKLSTDAIKATRDHEAKELEIVAACKEGEAKAMLRLEADNAALRRRHEEEMARQKEKKQRYKQQYDKMKAVYDECVAARSVLQSELLELQNLRAESEARIFKEVSKVREAADKEQVHLKRRISELKRVVVEKEQMLNVLREEVALGAAPILLDDELPREHLMSGRKSTSNKPTYSLDDPQPSVPIAVKGDSPPVAVEAPPPTSRSLLDYLRSSA